MKTVKVKDIGVQVKGVSYFKNNVFEVTDEDYEPIKEYVDILKEDKKSNQKNTNERIAVIKVENKELDLKEVEEYLYNCLDRFGKKLIGIDDNQNLEEKQEISNNNDRDTSIGSIDGENNPEGNNGEDAEENNESEDEELEALKERAQKLGINVTYNMKKETIIQKIEDAEKVAGENQNPEGE